MIMRWTTKLKILKTVYTNSNVANDDVVEKRKRDAVHAAGNVDHHLHRHDLILLLLRRSQHKLIHLVDPPSVAIVVVARVEVKVAVQVLTRAVVDPVLAAEAAVVAVVALALRTTVVIDDGPDEVARYRLEEAVPADPRMIVGVLVNFNITGNYPNAKIIQATTRK